LWPRKEIEVKVLGSYFFRMPVSVLLRLFTALLAAGVFTAGDGDDPVPGPVWFAPRLFPVVPWFRALEVLEPGEPPVPLIVLPFESVFPAEPLPAPELAAPPAAPPELPPELCARVKDVLPSSRLRITANNFMGIPFVLEKHQWRIVAIVPARVTQPARYDRPACAGAPQVCSLDRAFEVALSETAETFARSAVMNSQGDGLDSDRSKNILALASAPLESSIYPAGSMLGSEVPWFIQRDRWLAIPSRSQHCETGGRGSTGTRYLRAHGFRCSQ
jgi:hypothetical protein